ncbi:MAG: hypothetical protein AAF713_16895 [Pseudomonadota bacterium]
MTGRRGLMLLLPVALGAILVWQALATPPDPPRDAYTERSVPVTVVTVTPRVFVPQISGYGKVMPARVWSAVAQVSGAVASMHPAFVRGGFVAEGEVLVRIAADDYLLGLQSAEADLRHAEARVAEIRGSRHTNDALLAIEREALHLAEADLARTERLAQAGTVSTTVVEARRRDVLAQRSVVQSLENTRALLPA